MAAIVITVAYIPLAVCESASMAEPLSSGFPSPHVLVCRSDVGWAVWGSHKGIIFRRIPPRTSIYHRMCQKCCCSADQISAELEVRNVSGPRTLRM